MLCAISGEAPQQPVASRKSGNVFEKSLIEAYISENGADPVNGEELTVDDLVDLQQSRTVKPRPPTLTSIPALLSTFQNEWDALVLESYQLRQQLAETRQELSSALYYNDAAEKVIARLQKERDEARDALSRVTVSATTNGVVSDGDAMQVDSQSQGVPAEIVRRIEETQQQLSATRRKRPVPADWATADVIETFDNKQASNIAYPGSKKLAVDETCDHVLFGGLDGVVGGYKISTNVVGLNYDVSAGAINDSTWFGAQPVVSTTTGAVIVLDEADVTVKFTQHAGAATSIALHPCGDLLASTGVDKSYVLYDLSSGKVISRVVTDSELTAVAFHPDGHLLGAGTADGKILLYSVTTSELAGSFASSSSAAPIQTLSFSENGTWLASAQSGQSSVTVWDLRKLKELKILEIGTLVTGLSWDYTGQFLAACGPGGVVVNQYSKSSKSWSEPFRKAVAAVDVKWGAKAKSLIVLTNEGAVDVIGT